MAGAARRATGRNGPALPGGLKAERGLGAAKRPDSAGGARATGLNTSAACGSNAPKGAVLARSDYENRDKYLSYASRFRSPSSQA